jgi:hypothetical protein
MLTSPPKGKVVDHRDSNSCNNRRENLRICTQSQNRQNYKGVNPNNTSGYIGVTWSKRHQKWQAYVHGKTKYYNLGLFDDILDAVEARKVGEEKYFTVNDL